MPIAPGYRQCLQAAAAKAGWDINDEDKLEALFSRAQGRLGRYVAQGMEPADAAARAGEELAQEHLAAAGAARQTALQNLQKRVALRTSAADWAEGPLRASDGTAAPDRAIEAKIVGTTDPNVQGGRNGTESRAIARSKEYLHGAETELQKAGLLAVARSGALDRQVWQEMHALTRRGQEMGEKPGWSSSAEAAQIAGIYSKYYGLARVNLNKAGARIADLDDWVMHNSHDPMKLMQAGSGAWRTATLARLDQPRTLEDAIASGANVPDFMHSVWSALRTGVHLSDAGGVGMKEPTFTGPGNLAKAISQSRVLHWKDADSGYDQFKQFGYSGTLAEHMSRSLDRAARQEALLRDWGTNPQAEFSNTLRWFKEKYRDSDPAAVDRLDAQQKRLTDYFGRLTGENNRPANEMVSRLARGARALEVGSKLGNVVFSHLSSTASAARELQRQGESVFGSYRNAVASWLGPLQGEDAKAARDVLSASLEGAHTALAQHAFLEGGPAGAISSLQNRFMRMTGLPYAITWKKAGVAAGVARLLGRQLGRGFDDLAPETQRAFAQYGITPSEWTALRGVGDHFENSNGQTLLTPDAALRTGMDSKAAENLAMKLAAYYSDTADRATISPRIRDREILLRGTRPGDPLGEVARFISQFKTWPIAMARQTFDAEFRSGTPARAAIPGALQLVAGMTILGYLRTALADLSSGKNPEPITPGTLVSSLAQGGGAGIYGDFLFGSSNRFGQSAVETMLGPVLGEGTNTLWSIWNDLRDYATGNKKDLRSVETKLTKFAHQNTPFVNLFYTRLAADYLIWHSLQESVNPGYLERGERRLRQQTGQTYWLSPAEHAHTFGR